MDIEMETPKVRWHPDGKFMTTFSVPYVYIMADPILKDYFMWRFPPIDECHKKCHSFWLNIETLMNAYDAGKYTNDEKVKEAWRDLRESIVFHECINGFDFKNVCIVYGNEIPKCTGCDFMKSFEKETQCQQKSKN